MKTKRKCRQCHCLQFAKCIAGLLHYYTCKTQVVSGILQFTRQNTAQLISQCDLCSCLFKTSSSKRELILLRAIIMSFATLRRLRYVVSILTRADVAASRKYVVGNGINASRALFANLGYSCNILHRNSNSEELNLIFAS